MTLDTNTLKDRIVGEYDALGCSLGWRFLYSPEPTLRGARVAFIGLNPGGDRDRPDHPSFAPHVGSAYETERWEALPGQSKLQRQVRMLFQFLAVPAAEVLAGNLVPFRSPRWKDLPDPHRALRFGQSLWAEVLASASPRLIITMGRDCGDAVAELLGTRWTASADLDWAGVVARRADFARGTIIALPHLSRYQIIGRARSHLALRTLFEGVAY